MAEPRLLSAKPDERRVLRRSAWLRQGNHALFALTTATTIGAAAARVAGFALIGVITDAVVAGDRDRVWRTGLIFVGIVLVSFALEYAGRYLVVHLGENVVRRLRERAFGAVAGAPLRFLEAHRGGELVRRLTGEIADLSQFVGTTLPGVVNGSLLVILTVTLLIGYSWPLAAAFILIAAIAGITLVRGFLRRAPAAFAGVAQATADMSARFSESLPAQEQIRTLAARERRVETFAADNRRVLRARVNEMRTLMWLIALDLVGGLCVVTILGLAAFATSRDWISIGEAVVFVLASRTAFRDIEDLLTDLGEVRAARTNLARVIDLLESVETDRAVPRHHQPAAAPGSLVLTDVSYSYAPGQHALSEVNLTLRPGERVALVGPTGSGKTTLGKVIAGLYSPDRGTALLDGTPVEQAVRADAGGRHVALVPQEVRLVSGTIADNLAMIPRGLGPEPRTTMLKAAADLGLEEWLATLPDGLDTEVGDHGSRISAGERQLVALIRAVLVDPGVLVLDEATADVDPTTAARVEDAVAHLSPGRIVVVIAHRPDTVARADRLVEVVDGRVTS